ncbi:MAG: ABC transporter permease, partial [Acidobacteriota bacterium]
LAFGGVEVEEECRDARGTGWVHAAAQDVRYALRGFRRNPRFALSAMLAMALAIGGAAAVFSVVDRSLFRPLPYANQDRLVSIGIVAPLISPDDWFFWGTYQEWRRAETGLEALTAWRGVGDCDRNDGTPERLGCAGVAASFLPVLGVTPVVGRNFTEEEDQPGAEPVVILSHAFWMARFGGARDAVGRKITLDGGPARIIGVLPENFETPTLVKADLMVPLQYQRDGQKQRVVHVIARLRKGLTVEGAAASLAGPFRQFVESVPADFRKTIQTKLRVASLRDQQTRGYKPALWTLLGAVLAFVLIACTNVAHLLLARSAARRQEFAVRASMGASARRLASQTLTESLVLGVGGGALGCGLALLLLRVFQVMAPEGVLRMQEAQLDGRVLVFALALSVGTAVLFGFAPAWERLSGEALSGARTVGRSRNRLRPVLVAAQMAISLVLLTVSGMFLVSLWKLQQTRLGFTPANVVTASFILPQQRYATGERMIGFYRELERSLGEIPGVVAATITDSVPPGGDPRSRPYVAMIGGGDRNAPGMGGLVKWRYVTRGYFQTMRIPLTRGRGFTEEDPSGAEQAIVMSESLARRLYGKDDPIGKTVKLEAPMVVVGLAADVLNGGVGGAADAEFYVLRGDAPTGVFQNQRPPYGWRRATAVVRTTTTTQVALEGLRERIMKLEPSVALTLGSMDGEVSQFYAKPKFQTALLSMFAAIGLMLAAVGLYGLTSFLVVERTREAGVRIALGATPREIVRLMMGDGMKWTCVGLVVGSFVVAGVVQAMGVMMAEAGSFDVRVFVGAAGLLLVVAVAAAWLPSKRAAELDPMVALRQE